ncbi:MAG: glycosyltransferase family 4 protein [Deltaproteobacteria bacterium]
MKILFVHEVGYLEKPIFEMHEFPEHLAARGHEVSFVDLPESPSKPRTWKVHTENKSRLSNSIDIGLLHQNTWLRGIVGRLAAVVLFPAMFRRALANVRPDVVVSYSVPTSGWQALRISKRRGIPYVFRALDVSHKIRQTPFTYLILAAERHIYRHSDWVSCNNAAMRDYCIQNGASAERSSVNLPPLDLSHFSESKADPKSLRKKFGLPNSRPILLYMGSFFYFSGLKEVITSVAELEAKPLLVLIGGGEQDQELRDLVKELNLEDHVMFLGYVPYDELPEYLQIGDVAINPMKPSLVSNAALPNKVIQYMAAGMPVVCTKLDGVKSLFSNEQGLKFVEGPEELVGASLSFATENDLGKLGELNRLAVSSRFGLEISISDFEGLLLSLVRSK